MSHNFQTGIERSQLLHSQQALLDAGFLESDRSWVICAPTGAGKTRMAEWALLQAAGRGRRGVYLAPLRAIVEEKASDWAIRYPEYLIGLYTGEKTRQGASRAPIDEQFLLMTSEKLAAYLHRWKRHLAWLSEIEVVVLDEFHLMGDPSRGPTVESLIGRLQRINPFTRIVALSATVPNASQLARWLKAECFVTDWRPVPLSHRVVRFRKVSEKPDLLAAEIGQTIKEGGQTLVFVNSRRRSEYLSTYLRTVGFRAQFYHAGLVMEDRTRRQQAMRIHEIDALVSTSSLEMGVNFPARKVVIYDSYAFEGERFGPLPVGRYLQFAGRAGRMGFDDRGEAVIFLPVWHKNADTYAQGKAEPVASRLFQRHALQKEIITEVASRLSISSNHIRTNFLRRSFAFKENDTNSIDHQVDNLVATGLLKKTGSADQYLTDTPLGCIATQMDVSPETIQIIDRFYKDVPSPCRFDILLAICLCPDLSPRLPFSFEQLDVLGATLSGVPSHLLDAPPSKLIDFSPRRIPFKVILSAVKTACVLMCHTFGDSIESLATRFDCYPMDVVMLKRNCEWLLATSFRVFAYLWHQDWLREFGPTDDETRPLSIHEKRVKQLIPMINHGLPDTACELLLVKGIGPKRAVALFQAGIDSVAKMTDSTPESISHAIGLCPDICERFKSSANEVANEQAMIDPFEMPEEPSPPLLEHVDKRWPPGVDPYRLRRALDLRVIHHSAECIRIDGGTEPHTIQIATGANGQRNYQCDCMDAVKGHLCKHVMRARLECNDGRELLFGLRHFSEHQTKPLRYSLPELWIQGASLYDRYEQRPADYDGQRFLERQVATQRWQR